jgi:HTH-type transcriptional regulator/antitoxin HigA
MSERTFAEVFPPGEFVKDELDARGWTQNDLAEILGRPPRLISEIISGKRAVTPETARGFAAAFGTDPQLWMNLESAYRLSRAKPTEDAVQRRARLYGLFPMKEMIRRGWVESTERVEVLEQRILSFLGITSLDEVPSFLGAVARSPIAEATFAQCAWVVRVKQAARMTRAPAFTQAKLSQALKRLRHLLPSAEETTHVPRILSEAGIRFVVVEHLPGTRIDGICLWLDKLSPVVGISMRYDRIDWFWFTLLHELGHVKNCDGKTLPHIDADLVGETAQQTGDKEEREKAADQFASEFLIPAKEYEGFVARVKPLYSKTQISDFARRIGVHPGVVVGRLQRMKDIRYSHSRDLLERVRAFVTQSALTDGWGSVLPED